MNTKQGTSNDFMVDSRHIIIGGTLFGLGVGACIAGIAISGSAFLSAVQSWVGAMERPPSEVARGTWAQAKAAAAAGKQAWTDNQQDMTQRVHA